MDTLFYLDDVILIGATSTGVGKSYFSNLIEKTYGQHTTIHLGSFLKKELAELLVNIDFTPFNVILEYDIEIYPNRRELHFKLQHQFNNLVKLGLSSSQYFERMNNFYSKQDFRELMQIYGTEIKRTEDSDYWCKKLYFYCKENNITNVVIPDCRFSNEIVFFNKYSRHNSSVYLIDTKSVRVEHISENVDSDIFDIQIGWHSRLPIEKSYSQFMLVMKELGFDPEVSLNDFTEVVKCL